jgi:hypothetical protein
VIVTSKEYTIVLNAITSDSIDLINDENSIHPMISFIIAEIRITMPRSEWNIFTSRRIFAITGNAVIAIAIEKNNDTLNALVDPPVTTGQYHDAKKPTKKGIIIEKKLITTIDLPCFKMEDSSTSIPIFNIINISPKNTTPLRYPDEGKSHEKKSGIMLPINVGPITTPAII